MFDFGEYLLHLLQAILLWFLLRVFTSVADFAELVVELVKAPDGLAQDVTELLVLLDNGNHRRLLFIWNW